MAKNRTTEIIEALRKPVGTGDEPAIGPIEQSAGNPEPIRTGSEHASGIATFDPISGFDIDERNDGTTGTDFRTDSGIGPGASATGKRRGRPPGSRNINIAQKTPGALADIETILFSIHVMGAVALSSPELVLTKDESKTLGDAIKAVAVHYPLNLYPKRMAIANLAIVAGGIYAPRVLAIIRKPKATTRLKVEQTPIRTEPKPEPKPEPVQAQPPATAPVNGTPSEMWRANGMLAFEPFGESEGY